MDFVTFGFGLGALLMLAGFLIRDHGGRLLFGGGQGPSGEAVGPARAEVDRRTRHAFAAGLTGAGVFAAGTTTVALMAGLSDFHGAIVVGVVVFLAIIGAGYWGYDVLRRHGIEAALIDQQEAAERRRLAREATKPAGRTTKRTEAEPAPAPGASVSQPSASSRRAVLPPLDDDSPAPSDPASVGSGLGAASSASGLSTPSVQPAPSSTLRDTEARPGAGNPSPEPKGPVEIAASQPVVPSIDFDAMVPPLPAPQPSPLAARFGGVPETWRSPEPIVPKRSEDRPAADTASVRPKDAGQVQPWARPSSSPATASTEPGPVADAAPSVAAAEPPAVAPPAAATPTSRRWTARSGSAPAPESPPSEAAVAPSPARREAAEAPPLVRQTSDEGAPSVRSVETGNTARVAGSDLSPESQPAERPPVRDATAPDAVTSPESQEVVSELAEDSGRRSPETTSTEGPVDAPTMLLPVVESHSPRRASLQLAGEPTPAPARLEAAASDVQEGSAVSLDAANPGAIDGTREVPVGNVLTPSASGSDGAGTPVELLPDRAPRRRFGKPSVSLRPGAQRAGDAPAKRPGATEPEPSLLGYEHVFEDDHEADLPAWPGDPGRVGGPRARVAPQELPDPETPRRSATDPASYAQRGSSPTWLFDDLEDELAAMPAPKEDPIDPFRFVRPVKKISVLDKLLAEGATVNGETDQSKS